MTLHLFLSHDAKGPVRIESQNTRSGERKAEVLGSVEMDPLVSHLGVGKG